MNLLIHLLLIIPVIGFIVSVCLSSTAERSLSRCAIITTFLQGIVSLAMGLGVLIKHLHNYHFREGTIVQTTHYEFFIDLYFDLTSSVFLTLGAVLTLLVTIYSRYYLHREKGYKRFFCTILMFFMGYSITALSGNFETLFLGWEILGISSFLLIAFYRERYYPVRNALQVFSMYRIGDIGIILAMWASHHLWHSNITFSQLNLEHATREYIQSHHNLSLFLSVAIVLAACVKSAQMPFSFWLSRAMEGPTPSSAIFYGSLSVHLGAFLLLRTQAFWEHQLEIKILIISVGICSCLVAAFTAGVQTSIKAQIAYSSIAQIGLVFIEIALGWNVLALIHICGNAFLRTYQLLTSPSTVSYLIKEQFYNGVQLPSTMLKWLPERLRWSIYSLSLQEFRTVSLIEAAFWRPMRRLAESTYLIPNALKYTISILIFLGVLSKISKETWAPEWFITNAPILGAMSACVCVLKAMIEKNNPFRAWGLILLNHIWIVFAISSNETLEQKEIMLYLAGVLISGVIGWQALKMLQQVESSVHMGDFLGHSYEHPSSAFIFLVSVLGVSGFPITTTFVGEDMLYSHIHKNQYLLAFLCSVSFIFGGISAIRIYARIYLGRHHKNYHEISNLSS